MISLLPKEFVSQRSPFESFSKYRSVLGAHVLEIGGNANCVAALPFIQAGAERVVVSGLDHINDKSDVVINGIEIEVANALTLTEKFGTSAFNFIYGVSVLEHIPDHKAMWSQISDSLKPDGMAYLQGAPIWSSSHGHHIWLTSWANKTIKNYLFTPYAGIISINPIPNWGHLLYDKSTLKKILQLNPDVSAEDIDIILQQIYDSDLTNKLTSKYMIDCINNSGLIIRELEFDRVYLPQDIGEKLNLISKNEDFSIFGLRVIVQKR